MVAIKFDILLVGRLGIDIGIIVGGCDEKGVWLYCSITCCEVDRWEEGAMIRKEKEESVVARVYVYMINLLIRNESKYDQLCPRQYCFETEMEIDCSGVDLSVDLC